MQISTEVADASPASPRLEVTAGFGFKDLDAIEFVVVATDVCLIQRSVIYDACCIDMNAVGC